MTMTGYRLFKDGNAWCAVAPGFIDLQSSPAGFGDTKEEAVAHLLGKLRSIRPAVTLADFTIE